ncbi:MAG: hypothetical protein IT319_20895 [Anaerolineae bacterium]|nr:hypothetical protein [Anaerolineae bacterium]
MMKRTLLLTIVLLVVCVVPALQAAAQDSGGQVWVQAFEDRNGDGVHDPGEPFLTSGVSVDLLNADGVVMASGTLDNAPFASRGYVGFLYLSPGNYTAVISSPDMTPTTAARVDVTIVQGAAPVTVLYGAQRAALVEMPSSGGGVLTLPDSDLARVAVSGIAAIIVVGGMTILGVLVYLVVLRRRAPVPVRRTTTGSMRPVRVDQTGETRATGEARQSREMRRTGEKRPPGEIDRP